MLPHNILRFANQFSICMFAFLVLMLTACGGGGGGGLSGISGASVSGNTLTSITGPGDTLSYVPLNAGNRWFYNVTKNAQSNTASYSFMTTFVNGTKSVRGVTATVLTQQDSSTPNTSLDNYYYQTPGGVSYLGNNDTTDLVSPLITPSAQMLFPVQPGKVSLVTGTNLPFGSDGSGNAVTMDLTQSISNVGIEAVSVSAGNYPNAMKQVTTVNGTVKDAALGQSYSFTEITTDWLVPGIGIVKETSSMTADLSTTITSHELRGYVVNGVHHGMGVPMQVANGLAAPNSDMQNPGAPSLASDGTNFLAVSSRANATAMQGTLMDSQGGLIKTISLPAGVSPTTAFDGTNYWVTSLRNVGGCQAQRINMSGVVLDAAPLVLSTIGNCSSQQHMAFGSSNGLVVYIRYNSGTSRIDLYGALLNPNGTIGTEFPIMADTADHHSPVVAFDGTNYLVVWEQGPTTYPPTSTLYGARVSTTGSTLDVSPIPISTNTTAQYSPSLAFDGTNYLIAWLDLRTPTGAGIPGINHPDVYANRLSPAGILQDGSATGGGFLISAGPTKMLYSPNVGYDGTEYFVSWGSLDYGNQGGIGLQAATVSKAGTLNTSSKIQVSSVPSTATWSRYVYPVFAKSNTTSMLVWLDNSETSGIQKGLVGLPMAPF